jgi:hypothetical protein
VRRSGNRFSVNAMSAIGTKTRVHFMVVTEKSDSKVTYRFPGGGLAAYSSGRSTPVVDRAWACSEFSSQAPRFDVDNWPWCEAS